MFAYTIATTRPNWDLTFLSEHLIDQIVAWRAEHRATHPPTDNHPASPTAVRPPSLSVEPPEIPLPPPEVLLEQVIEDESTLAIRSIESDWSVEQIDNPNGVLDCQEE